MGRLTLPLAAACLALVLSAARLDAKEYEYAISFCSSGTTTLLSRPTR
jgi:hypothetical protein